ncbi:proline-rich protein 5-like [Scleropages formosus]|uniref:Proline rich 5 like n=1 Tax=Scleropages formosus TaxID=113540 RepID=A0A8C9QYP2_SCLFO|nr:proline-rich protein 5-like [Scleropages formosus]XP_018621093.1 proline-rich protein 5-like [Scleropages formosus]
MGSLRRPRPRFMSSPVLTDLPRFYASAPSLQLSNASVWNSVQSAVIKVFQGGGLQTNELFTLNESIRWLLKTELGSFITEYFQNQLLNKGLVYILEKIQLYEGENQLLILSEMWTRFFTEILPTLQAIFYPVQGQELTVRQMALLGFRDLVLLKLPLAELLPPAPIASPPFITQMLLVLQGIHEPSGPSHEYCKLERLVEMVVSPYLGNYLHQTHNTCLLAHQAPRPRVSAAGHLGQPEILITQHATDSSSLAPLVEQEGEAYLEKAGGVRRHTVANAHSDLRLLSVASMMCPGMEEDGGGSTVSPRVPKHFFSEPHILESPADVEGLPPEENCTQLSCPPPS